MAKSTRRSVGGLVDIGSAPEPADGAGSGNRRASEGDVSEEQTHPVTKEDLREAKDDLRRELKLWVSVGLVGGQAFAALIGIIATKDVSFPADVAQAGTSWFLGLFG